MHILNGWTHSVNFATSSTAMQLKAKDHNCFSWSTRDISFRKWVPFCDQRMKKQKNGIKHITVAPYHPASNGLLERVLRPVKERMKKQGWRYCSCSSSCWASLMSHRDLLRPNLLVKVNTAQSRKKKQHYQHSRMRAWNSVTQWIVKTIPGGTGGF